MADQAPTTPKLTGGEERARHRAGSSSPSSGRRRLSEVWCFDALLVAVALGLWAVFVRPLPQTWGAVHVALPVTAALFAMGESWRVYIHFKRHAQSYALSEVLLVLALFFASADELIIARVIGAAVAFGVVRRQPPVKLVFNLASFAIECEVIEILFSHLVHGYAINEPMTWAVTLLIVAFGSLCGFMLGAVVISLAEHGFKRRQWLQPATFVIVAAAANTSLGLEVVSVASRNPWEMVLLLVPLAVMVAAYTLYTREHQKREQLQYLYQSSDLLQRATNHRTALPELLTQMCSIFRAERAELALLPSATGADDGYLLQVIKGVVEESTEQITVDALERFAPIVQEDRRGVIITSQHARAKADTEWLSAHTLRDAMLTPLQSEGVLLGVLMVGNRLSDVSTFDTDDLALFETFAAQASVSVQNLRLDHRLKHQAFHDPLTGLANRALFRDRLEHALTRRENQDPLAVIFLDLDDFKMVNDSLGHSAGDDLLRAVADRLHGVLRPSDTAARFGGDEFAVLVEDAGAPEQVIAVCERIVGAFKPHFVAADREVAVHASVGVATATSGAIGAGELLRHADVAMYRAKLRGGNAFEIFEPGMQEAVTHRLEIRTDLERALERGELTVHYQPLFDMETRTAVSVEALVRWRHPRWGMVLPGEFIMIAEETGLIRDIGLFVLEQASRDCQRWQSEFPDHNGFSVSVNVSPRQLREPNFADAVWRVLSNTGLHPSRLVLEITEGFMVDEPAHAGELLRALKSLGVRISIDDFGTGYSSLSALQDLPIDILKIDKAFVDHVADDPRRAAFAQAIIRMGKTLGLGLIAEGVENARQAERLSSLGCRIAQGYHFGRPVEAEVIRRILAATTPSASVSDDSDEPALLVLPASGEFSDKREGSRRFA